MEAGDFIQTDVFGTHLLLEWVRERGGRLVHVSTDEVYGDIEPGYASREGDALRPSSPYSASQGRRRPAGARLRCAPTASTPCITRGSNNYGPNQYPEKLIPLFTTNLLDGEPVPVYGDGRQSRDFIYVEDHCAGIETVLERGASGEIYNVGGGNEIENLDDDDAACSSSPDATRATSATSPTAPATTAATRSTRASCRASAGAPRSTFDEGLRRTVEWYREQPRLVGADQERRRLRRVPAQAVRRRRQVTETPAAPDATGGYLDALAVGEFRALFAAYTVSMLGDIVAAVALTVLVFERTGSPFLAGVTFTLAFLPYLFGGALLSSLVDRVPPRRLMIGCDLLSAAVVALMALLGRAGPRPARAALPAGPDLARRVGHAQHAAHVVLPAETFIAGRSLFRIVAQSAQVFGNGLGGVADRADLAARSARARLRELPRLRARRARGDARAAAAARRGRRSARAVTSSRTRSPGCRPCSPIRRLRRVLLLGWLVPTCAVAPEALAAPYVADLGLSAGAVGWWLAAIPAGTIAGELVAIWFVLAGLAAAAHHGACCGDVRPAARVRRPAGPRGRAPAARRLRPLQRVGARSGRAASSR